MATTYNIHLVNESENDQLLWCFLAPPEELKALPGVFANSSANLLVREQAVGNNAFQIPVQYIVGAGASNEALGPKVKVISDVTNPAELGDTWEATYFPAPPPEGPAMKKIGDPAGDDCIAIKTDPFPQESNEDAGWYSNQSFGMQTQVGFIGMTWSPEPNKTRTLKPKLTFYVSAGDYDSNVLADWTDISNSAATINAPDDFAHLHCTVTYTAAGKWTVTPGVPPQHAVAANLKWFRSAAHAELMALAYLEEGTVDTDTVTAVSWESTSGDAEADVLTGTVTVATALGAAFAYFMISGIRVDIEKPEKGATSFRFRFSGAQGGAELRSLLKAGAKLLFGGKS